VRPFRGTARFYADYRYRPSEAFARLLAEELGWTDSDRVLDLGAGPAHVSLLLAPLVGEVVVMDPEPDMIEEGRRRAAAAGVDNLSFVTGGSDDLSPQLGEFAAVTMSQSFHRMPDQDGVLRQLERIAGAVALLGYVKEPDYNRAWLDREPWNVVEPILERHLDGVPELPAPPPHDPFPDILARSAFSQIDLLTHEYEAVVQPSVDAAIGFVYSLSNKLVRLGDRRAAFEDEVRTMLADADTSPFPVRLVDSALIGRRG
jgi:SAM-dependent methyltransferase